jgi:hypothetical protein
MRSVIIHLDESQIFGQACDLCRRGISIRAHLKLAERSVHCRFVLPGGYPVELDGAVVHQTRWQDGYVIGVEFLDVPRRVGQTIQEYIDGQRGARRVAEISRQDHQTETDQEDGRAGKREERYPESEDTHAEYDHHDLPHQTKRGRCG